MSERRPAVSNAADIRQVRLAETLERRRAERFTQALAAVMDTPPGRIVLAALIRRAGVYRSVWSPSVEIHYRAGQQDYGHHLMADVMDLSETHYQLMEREEWAWAKHEEQTIAAAQQTRRNADEGDRHDDSE